MRPIGRYHKSISHLDFRISHLDFSISHLESRYEVTLVAKWLKLIQEIMDSPKQSIGNKWDALILINLDKWLKSMEAVLASLKQSIESKSDATSVCKNYFRNLQSWKIVQTDNGSIENSEKRAKIYQFYCGSRPPTRWKVTICRAALKQSQPMVVNDRKWLYAIIQS